MNPMNRTLDTKTPFQNYRYRKGETRNENTRVLPFSDSRLRLDNCLQGLKEQRDSGDISTDLRMHSDLIMRSLDRQFKLISQLESQLASMRRSISGPNLLPNKNDVLNRFSSRMDYLHD